MKITKILASLVLLITGFQVTASESKQSVLSNLKKTDLFGVCTCHARMHDGGEEPDEISDGIGNVIKTDPATGKKYTVESGILKVIG